MKTITSLVFTVLCLCFFAGTAKAQTVVEWSEGGIWYRVIDTDKVAVCQNPAGQDYTGTVNVPTTVIHNDITYTVTAVGNRAFAYAGDAESTVEYVHLPPTIVSFGGCAFQFCSGLKSIVIPDATVALWDDDFDGIDDGEGGTFMGCIGLEEITIGSGITNMAAPNGLFNPRPLDFLGLKKVTCYATTPPAIDVNTFLGDVSKAVLLVPEESLNAYLTDYWWNFSTAEQHEDSYGAGIYPIGTLLPPWNLKATMTGLLTWWGDAGAYNIIISGTELDEVALAAYPAGDILRTTDAEYDATFDATEGVNYAYLRSDYGEGNTSAWVSISFFYYTGSFCEYTVSGQDIYYTVDPDDEYTNPEPWGWDHVVHLEFWQAGNLIETVDGDAAFEGATVSLLSGIPVTLEWKGEGEYGDPCSLTLKDAAGNIVLFTDELLDWEPKTWNLSIDNNCNATVVTGIKTLNMNNASVTPTLSNGLVTVNAEAGSVVKVMDLTGRLLKQEAITGADQKIELNYANGVYLILLENSRSRFVQKVILKR
ncbi:MAG: leucine-rich repeat domain-containing protein [Dysgonamonadaceae bacterium]|nr:leucine-rich repeat domain-containing protein [Dysgonamonadaceae bacterium]